MHPTYHTQRRIQRPKGLQKRLQRANDILYADAAEYSCYHYYVPSAVDSNGNAIIMASTTAASSEEAEHAAVALALSSADITMIISGECRKRTAPAKVCLYTRGHTW